MFPTQTELELLYLSLPSQKLCTNLYLYRLMDNIIKKLIALVWVFLFLFINANAQDVTLSGPGGCNGVAVSGSWTVPCDVTSITVQIYGGGGGGGGRGGGSNGGIYDSRGGGGGGAGGYSTITINVTPGTSFNYTIGAGGCGGGGQPDGQDGDNGSNGAGSTFSGTSSGGTLVNLSANGGARGTGGDGSEGSAGSGGAGGTASGGSTNTSGTAGANGNSGNGGAGGAGTYGAGGNGGGDPGAGGTSGGILITFTTTSPAAAPIIASTPATCTVAGSSTISNYDPAATYTFSPIGPFPLAGGNIGGMTNGTTYTVTVGTGGCVSVPSAPFSNAAAGGAPLAPTISTAPPTCSANGISTVTNYNASYTYNFTPAGPTADAGGVISGMTPGTNYTVIADGGGCFSPASASFSIAAQLAAPAVPTVTSTPATCVANGSSTISNYNAAYTYIFSPAGPSASGGGAITGMVTGTNYTVQANDGNCSSAASAAFSNAALTPPPAVPAVSTLPPSCSSAGMAAITNYSGALTYTFTPAGPAAGVGGVITGMTAGTNYTVESDDGSCSSGASASFSVAAQLATPPIPTITTTPPSCVADGSSLISNYNAAFTYAFTPSGPSVGGGGAISGMTVGTNYTVTADDGNCPSAASASFSNGALTAPPAVPTIATLPADCSSDGIAAITNYNGSLNYTFTPAGPAAGAGGVITGMTPATNYTVEADDGSCNSGESASFSIGEQLTVPTASISGSLTYCTGGTTTLTASGGTSYTWTDAGGANIGNSASVTVAQGTYTVEIADASGCTDDETVTVTESTNLTVTIAGILTYCEGANTTLTASGGTSYVWSDGSTSAAISATDGSYTVTATDGGCSGTATADVTEIPVAPFRLGSDVTSCVDSLVILDAGSGYTTYAWNSGENTQTIATLSSGQYTATVTDANGCETEATVNVVFNECLTDSFTIYIPNAFSPNSDRDNDAFRIYGTNITDLDLRIFNRWGQQIFDANGLNSSWNGITYNLIEAEMGVYAYVVDISLQSGYKETFRGIVTLVR
jgi:gliding motility-associated-like protein